MNNERAELIRALNSEAELLSQMGYCGAPKLMREAAALLAADAQGVEPLTIANEETAFKTWVMWQTIHDDAKALAKSAWMHRAVTPPQPQAVPLTKAEIINALAQTHDFDSTDFDSIIEPVARAIEAAHGIGGKE